jgi:glycosyltransferase involved in cell wall biosynthesis
MADILFAHPEFPGQFEWLARHLVKDQSHRIKALARVPAEGAIRSDVEGVEVQHYGTEVVSDRPLDHVLHYTDSFIRNAASLALKAEDMRKDGFDPDVIYTHSGWGAGAFLHNVFPRARQIKYCEWYYNRPATGVRFLRKDQPVERIIADDLLNLPVLAELAHADRLISPTEWQRDQFPPAYKNQITVIPDGLDPELFREAGRPQFTLDDGRVLGPQDKVITYVARGADMFRGFETFVEALALLAAKGVDFNCLIAGGTRSHYGPGHGTNAHFKSVMERVALDSSRVHFLGTIERERYLRLLRVSSVHIYLTVPFVLSWSMLEAMAAGCAIVASDTPPVAEFLADRVNGRLVDFFDAAGAADAIAQVLKGGSAVKTWRNAARDTVRQRWSLEKALSGHMQVLDEMLNGRQA